MEIKNTLCKHPAAKIFFIDRTHIPTTMSEDIRIEAVFFHLCFFWWGVGFFWCLC